MSSGFPGDFFAAGRRSATVMPANLSTATTAFNNTTATPGNLLNQRQQNHQFSFHSPLAHDPMTQIHRPDFIGKRSLAEFQNQGLNFYLRNVKPRPSNNIYQHASPISPLSPADFSTVSQQNYPNPRYSFPVLSFSSNNRNGNFSGIPHGGVPRLENTTSSSCEFSDKTMMSQRLQQLEKQLLGDDEDEAAENISVVTNSEWSETIQSLLGPVTKSPTSSSSSSSGSSTLVSPPLQVCAKQALIDAAIAISDGKTEAVTEILTGLERVASVNGTPEQRLAFYILRALKPRVNSTEDPSPVVTELYGEEHVASTQMLYDVSPCFKLGFMAANLTILDATSQAKSDKIHIVDFEIGHGKQYLHLLHALRNASSNDKHTPTSLTITTFTDFPGDETLKRVGDNLKSLAEKIGFPLSFQIKKTDISNLTRQTLDVQPDEALVVNLAYKLYRLPDESVTVENLRDDLLRRVKSLSPEVVTVVEQELNSNTAPLIARVRDARDYYGALFESLDKTLSRDNAERVKIEAGLGRRIWNLVACEGRERVERCEVFGKWRARMGMAGFQTRPVGPNIGEFLRSKLNSGTRGNPGFTVSDQAGGVCFGWIGRTLTVVSAWR